MALPTLTSNTAKKTADAVGEASVNAAKAATQKVFDLTIKPLKSLFTFVYLS